MQEYNTTTASFANALFSMLQAFMHTTFRITLPGAMTAAFISFVWGMSAYIGPVVMGQTGFARGDDAEILPLPTPARADITFDDAPRTVDPATSELTVAEATASLTEMQMPLSALIRETAQAMVAALGLEKADQLVEGLATRWQRGTVVLKSADESLQPKEVPLETFFHKIVMIRNNLRVLEQKVNANEKLSDADKFDLQQYITRCYGSLTTFNVLFKNKEDQFGS